MEEDERIEIDSARVATSADLMDVYHKNGHSKDSKEGAGYEPPSRRTVAIFTTIVALLIVTPFLFTFIGAVTGPPRIGRIPVGHLLFLTGDEPSEHTTTLRGLFMVDNSGNMHLLAHDTEPQDTDSGSRSWIDEPEVSPDGKWVAYLQDQIILEDEVQSISQQLCAAPLDAGQNAVPKTLDLTKLGYKRVVGLAWSTDSQKISLLNNDHIVQVVPLQIKDSTQVDQAANPSWPEIALPGLPALESSKYVSPLSYPTITASDALYFIAKTPQGSELFGSVKPLNLAPDAAPPVPPIWPLQVPAVAGYGLSSDGSEAALVPDNRSHEIRIIDTATGQTRQTVTAKWGWSVFGGRQITSVGFSPDTHYLIYTVSKPPVPEEEMFLLDLSTGEVHLLPYRSGRASWTWVK